MVTFGRAAGRFLVGDDWRLAAEVVLVLGVAALGVATGLLTSSGAGTFVTLGLIAVPARRLWTADKD